MNRKRFDLALKQLDAGDGALFEQLASSFAVVEYGELRTVAAFSGDGGQDAFLYSPSKEPDIVLQYSVTKYTSDKIRKTARRLQETSPDLALLIYVTSQDVGVKADELRRKLRRDFNITLDVWDRNWFLDRVNTHPQREEAAENLAHLKVDPLLAKHEVISSHSQNLDSEEEKTAALYLALQYADEEQGKGLTKVCFDSLVRAALRGTDSDHRIKRDTVHARVKQMVPNQQNVASFVDNSLRRLSKSVIRYRQHTDEFSLSHDETVRIKQRMTELELHKADYRADIKRNLEIAAQASGTYLDKEEENCAAEVMTGAIDQLLFSRGESFASTLTQGRITNISGVQLEAVLHAAMDAWPTPLNASTRQIIVTASRGLLMSPGSSTRQYLRQWSDSYALFSLLKETPDVQKTVVKLFSSGRIWIDTNLLLPVLAEELADPEDRSYTRLLAVAREAGLSLRVAKGVVEELSAHMGRSLAYARHVMQGKTWHGDVPFLYASHALSGGTVDSFAGWVETFRGDAQPELDVQDYLMDVHGIRLQDLRTEADKADVELRGAVQEVWIEARARNRRDFDPVSVRRLVDHDVESYVGVIQLRRQEKSSSLGYNTWWLTLDSTAYRMHRILSDRLSSTPPSPPVMSPDFLLNYLEIGPLRTRIDRQSISRLPLVNDLSFLEGVSTEVLRTVEKIRRENEELPRRVIRRKIRDAMNKMRTRPGAILEGGVAQVETEVLAAISKSATGEQ